MRKVLLFIRQLFKRNKKQKPPKGYGDMLFG